MHPGRVPARTLYCGGMGPNDRDETETTEDLKEGTREAKEAAQEALAEVHQDAEELEERLEDEGLTPDTPGTDDNAT